LAVTLAISAILFFLLGPIDGHQRFARQGIATLLLIGNIGAYKYSGDYFQPDPNPLVHTWSLSVEAQIYIFLPFLLILILHNCKELKKIATVVFGVISALSFVSFLFPAILEPLYTRGGIELPSLISFYSTIDRIWQFTVGGLAFLLQERYQKRISKSSKRIHFLTVIPVVIILFGPVNVNLRVSSVMASFFAVIVILFSSLNMLPNFLIQKLAWVGDRSYSIYLIHMPLLYLAKHSPATHIGSSENRLIQTTIAIVASISLGSLSYSKVENRYRNIGERKAISLKTITAGMVSTILLPVAQFIVMDRGSEYKYWGLERNIQQPPYAGFLDPNCQRDSFSGPPCVYTNMGSTKTVLLVGDSHAGHISQAIVDAAQSTKWNAVVWTNSSCPIQFERRIPDQISDQCIDINNSKKQWVEENKPDAIIVSQFVRSDSSINDLKKALRTLQSIVPNLLLIENNPIFPDERDFMVRRPLVLQPYKAPKLFKQTQMEFRDMNASNLLANWARKNNIYTMNFESLFCNGEICTRWSEAGWLYRDDDHFSVIGASLTIPQIITFLKML
jgi:peptidoglycan/LPS O-acetylase OafA/YrhL